jgi:hypothetical protein
MVDDINSSSDSGEDLYILAGVVALVSLSLMVIAVFA